MPKLIDDLTPADEQRSEANYLRRTFSLWERITLIAAPVAAFAAMIYVRAPEDTWKGIFWGGLGFLSAFVWVVASIQKHEYLAQAWGLLDRLLDAHSRRK